MPWRKLISNSSLSGEDTALLENLFNQTVRRDATDEERHALARDVVSLFASGIRSEAELVKRLAERRPSVTKSD